ncbi:MAG: hypothetical protein K9G76_11825 [Bacteroidales bacterium]|nr:hypothetical protein [Bacteroidales bacterium]MCF8405131.1 hypothetical protein [Bacteroidales bacterium]
MKTKVLMDALALTFINIVRRRATCVHMRTFNPENTKVCVQCDDGNWEVIRKMALGRLQKRKSNTKTWLF